MLCKHVNADLWPFCSQATTKLFIDGKFIESKTSEWLDIHNPVSTFAYFLPEKATCLHMESVSSPVFQRITRKKSSQK